MPSEFLRLLKPIRKDWLRPLEKYRISISYETGTDITPRTIEVAEAFGLGIDRQEQFVIYDNVQLDIGKKDVVYITGESGSGKSVLLKFLANELKSQAVNIADIHPDPDKPLIDVVGNTIEQGLELLAKVGLGDAFLFVRRFSQLSDGQKYRFLIAKLIESQKQFWIMDEFCATLDRDTAKIVAYNVQKLARQLGKGVLAATTHIDLFEDLHPSLHIHKRFGKEIQVNYYPNEPCKECSLLKEIRVEQGTTADYRVLSGFHYRSHHVGAVRKIFRAVRNGEVCGAIVYTYPAIGVSGRRRVLPKMEVSELNQKLSNIMRVVVHPKYRTIGVGQKLVRETLEYAGTPYVETTAVMAKYNPFFEKARMTKIQETQPAREAEAIRSILAGLGFDITLLGSEKYVLSKLATLADSELLTVKQAFKQHTHLRFMKEFFYHLPYGKKEAFKTCIEEASPEKLAKLINVVGLLLQTKVYLFWKKQARN
jgi:ABC-type transport system involved in cytochrome c biogenesis ATPase subunit/GNAT superfamily N-acetyltransferase